jgi:hypothetical protein
VCCKRCSSIIKIVVQLLVCVGYWAVVLNKLKAGAEVCGFDFIREKSLLRRIFEVQVRSRDPR